MSTKRGLERLNLNGSTAANILRRVEQASSACAEMLGAAREIARARLERVERLLGERARSSSAINESEVTAEVVVNNKLLPETQAVLSSITSSATTLSGADG